MFVGRSEVLFCRAMGYTAIQFIISVIAITIVCLLTCNTGESYTGIDTSIVYVIACLLYLCSFLISYCHCGKLIYH